MNNFFSYIGLFLCIAACDYGSSEFIELEGGVVTPNIEFVVNKDSAFTAYLGYSLPPTLPESDVLARFNLLSKSTIVVANNENVVGNLVYQPRPNESIAIRNRKFQLPEIKPQLGETYDVEVTFPDGKRFSHSIRIPEYGEVISTKFYPDQLKTEVIQFRDTVLFHKHTYEIAISDQAQQKTYYLLRTIQILNLTGTSFGLGNGFMVNLPRDDAFIYNSNEVDPQNFRNNFPYNIIAFSDDIFDGKEFKLNMEFLTSMTYADYQNAETFASIFPDLIILQEITEPYYLYIRTAALIRNNDQLPFVEPSQMYTNVKGGTGIFGAIRTLHVRAFSARGEEYLSRTAKIKR